MSNELPLASRLAGRADSHIQRAVPHGLSLGCNFSGRNLEFDLKAAVRRVAGCDHAAVQTRNPVRNRQAQAHTAGLPVARVLYAIERLEDVGQLRLRNPRAMVTDGENAPG